MSLADRMMGGSEERDCICSNCNRKYHQRVEEQVPGFRERDDDICPYCHTSNGSSMSYEYYNCTMEEYRDRMDFIKSRK